MFGSGLHFMQASYYASPELSRRFVYTTDREKAIRYRETDGVDAAFVLGQRYFNVAGRIVDYETLRREYTAFWFYSNSRDQLNWLHKQLSEDGAEITDRSATGLGLFRVRLPSSRPAPLRSRF